VSVILKQTKVKKKNFGLVYIVWATLEDTKFSPWTLLKNCFV